MKALVDVENIHKYNWAEFVLHDIKDAAAALQHKIRHRKSIGYINGCIILPQVRLSYYSFELFAFYFLIYSQHLFTCYNLYCSAFLSGQSGFRDGHSRAGKHSKDWRVQ
jgi:hypothetical protein